MILSSNYLMNHPYMKLNLGLSLALRKVGDQLIHLSDEPPRNIDALVDSTPVFICHLFLKIYIGYI